MRMQTSSSPSGTSTLTSKREKDMIKIKEIWFNDDQIFGRDEDGRIYSQSLLWYPRLRAASAEEREKAILAHIHQLGEELMAANF